MSNDKKEHHFREKRGRRDQEAKYKEQNTSLSKMGGLKPKYQNRRDLFHIEKCKLILKLKRTDIKQSEVK